MKGEQYLTTPAQYGLVYSKGNSWANDLLVLKALPNQLSRSRYGFSVSRRVGGAVVRNHAKRLLREILRRAPLRPGWDIVFIARSPAAGASYDRMEKSVKNLLSRARLITGDYERVCPETN